MIQPRDMPFHDSDGGIHKPGDPDYWQAKVRHLGNTVRELQAAIVDLQLRVAELDKGEVHWPGDTYPPPTNGLVGVVETGEASRAPTKTCPGALREDATRGSSLG